LQNAVRNVGEIRYYRRCHGSSPKQLDRYLQLIAAAPQLTQLLAIFVEVGTGQKSLCKIGGPLASGD
jgi:hypothetical protein